MEPAPTNPEYSLESIEHYRAILEARYPVLYARVKDASSQKHLERCIEEMSLKVTLEDAVKDLEALLAKMNDGVYDALAAVDKARQQLDVARERLRDQKYSYLPY